MTRCRPVLRALHIASLVYAIIIESVPWPPCSLTVAESWLEARAGVEASRGPFLVHILDAIVYLNFPVWLVVGGAVFVCAGILVGISSALSSPQCIGPVVMGLHSAHEVR